MSQILGYVIGAAFALLNGYLIFKMNRNAKGQDERDKALQELDIRVNAQDKACALCRASLLTEEKLRAVLQEQFNLFELRLINQGRLSPLQQKERKQ